MGVMGSRQQFQDQTEDNDLQDQDQDNENTVKIHKIL
jgi:hypothetical protein